MAKPSASFRIGKVQGYIRGEVWYLCYYEDGRRRRPRVGPDKDAARQLAAQVNAQLQTGAPAALSFEPIAIPDLRQRWLDHHEHVLRSSVQTINRYRTATDHLLRYLETHPVRQASHFQDRHAEQFIRHLRGLRVSPNGHAHTAKRPLMDKGLRYVLECCRALFNFAIKRRHMPPYAANPFQVLEVDRIPIEQARPITLFTVEQDRTFFEACDEWQFPLFLTLALTGLRSELMKAVIRGVEVGRILRQFLGQGKHVRCGGADLEGTADRVAAFARHTCRSFLQHGFEQRFTGCASLQDCVQHIPLFRFVCGGKKRAEFIHDTSQVLRFEFPHPNERGRVHFPASNLVRD